MKFNWYKNNCCLRSFCILWSKIGVHRCHKGPQTPQQILELFACLSVYTRSFQRGTTSLCRPKAFKTAGLDLTWDFQWAAIHYVKPQKIHPRKFWLSAVLQPFDVQKRKVQKIIWWYLFECKKLWNFTVFALKFNNCHHTNSSVMSFKSPSKWPNRLISCIQWPCKRYLLRG